MNAPAATDESRSPYNAGPPPSRSASAGNNARGMPNTMASRSIAKMLITTEWPRKNRKPSNTDVVDAGSRRAPAVPRPSRRTRRGRCRTSRRRRHTRS